MTTTKKADEYLHFLIKLLKDNIKQRTLPWTNSDVSKGFQEGMISQLSVGAYVGAG